MSPPRVSVQGRRLTYPDGSLHYEVTATVIDRGTVLPVTELFVVTIQDALNPRADTLARVATPHDLRTDGDDVYVRVASDTLITISGDPFARVANVDELSSLPADRLVAVRRGLSNYRTTSVTLVYDTLTTAEAASRQLVDRLSKLTTDYAAYISSFLTTSPVIYQLPVASRSVEATLASEYAAKKAARIAAEAARASAQLAKDACQTEDQILAAKIDFLVSDVAFLEAAKTLVTGMTETASVVGGSCTVAPTATATHNVKTFVLDASNERSYESLLVTKRAALVSFRATLAARDSQCSSLARQLAEAEAAVITARADENTTLRRVLSTCPTFNPDSV